MAKAQPQKLAGQTQFNLSNIPQIDNGRVQLAIDHQFRTALKDVMDRPGDKSKRTVVLQFEFMPQLQQDSAQLDSINMQVSAGVKIPTRRNTKPYNLMALDDGIAVFQPHSPHDARQLDLSTVYKDDDAEPIDETTAEQPPNTEEFGEI
ncbi:hypothetical protein LCGC14_1469000 [marine sediment metagenome]|uniref:Uncharacterized protein n=1 Tax=marine sediment metagenome TaxID=412755 RepID=A0A0F9JDG7_9ZZZZ